MNRKVPILSLLLPFVLAFPASAQTPTIQEEDLPPDTFTQLTLERIPLEALQAQFDEATRLYLEGAEPAEAITAFTDLIDLLNERRAAGVAEGGEERLLADSLSYRARAQFNLAEVELAEADLRALVEVEPGYELDPNLVSPKLISRLDALKKQLVASLDLVVSPPDATAELEGLQGPSGSQVVAHGSGPVAVLAGERLLKVSRPGFGSVEESLDLPAGKSTGKDITLERQSAVLIVSTTPPGATVTLNGREVGTTEGTLPEGYPLSGDAARLPRGAISDLLYIDDLEPGEYTLEVTLPEHRVYGARVTLPELKDYETGVLALERTEGRIVLDGVPERATVYLNGRPVQAERVAAGRSDRRGLRLPPGRYHVRVVDGTRGMFEDTILLQDRQTATRDVELRPAVVLVGILGDDPVAARKLAETLRTGAETLDDWAFVDAGDRGETVGEGSAASASSAPPNAAGDGKALADTFGADAEALRALAAAQRVVGEDVDWAGLQKAADARIPGAVYLLAVLNDDLLATAADLWLWSAAPGPARPDRRRVRLEPADDIRRVLDAFARPVAVQRPWLGAQLMDSLAAEGPIVVAVTAGSPADAGGLKVGDEVRAITGTTMTDADAVRRAVEGLRPGSSASFTLRNAGGERTVDVRLGSSPAVVALDDPDRIYATVSSTLSNARRRDQAIPEWLVLWNQAAVFLHGAAWEEAVRALRQVRVPVDAADRAGLRQASVDYWLALALRGAGPQYLDQAREALRRAAADPEARLLHNDGPLVAPRARARLYQLGEP